MTREIEEVDGDAPMPKYNAYMVGFWFMGNDVVDFLLQAWKDEGTDHFRATYRFRYHRDEKIFDSEDEKHWYSLEFQPGVPEDEIVMNMHLITKQLGNEMGVVPEFVPVRSKEGSAIFDALKDKPWAHIKVLTPEQQEVMRKERES